MIELNDLLGYKNRKIYQNRDYFSFTLDSVLLAEFATIKLTTKKILDIGSGTGAIPLLLSTKTKAHIDAVEIQKSLCELFQKSIHYNQLESQISLFCEDIKNSSLLTKNNDYDLIVCNPPYFKNSKTNSSLEKSIARHELFLTLEEVVKISKKLLKDKGRLAIVYDSKRLIEAFQVFQKNNLVPKRLKMIHDQVDKEASTILIECIKNGNHGLKIESPFILYNENKEKTKQYEKLIKE